ncbi:MAG: hypothetical protein KIT16_23040, partial [Rhodospirillaceae bacterium]|nr:hypothetical protein [Rhodospirillaceae bacterium]
QREFAKTYEVKVTAKEHVEKYMHDLSKILVYTEDDLKRTLRDFAETEKIIGHLVMYLHQPVPQPPIVAQTTQDFHPRWPFPKREELLRRLSSLRLFATALSDIRKKAAAQKTPEALT